MLASGWFFWQTDLETQLSLPTIADPLSFCSVHWMLVAASVWCYCWIYWTCSIYQIGVCVYISFFLVNGYNMPIKWT